MSYASLATCIMVLSMVLVTCAATTDLRERRIPNYITFPGIAVGLGLYLFYGGRDGLILSASGMVLAPCVLHVAHGGHGPGMGDLKLAAAIGALLAPPLATVVMMLSVFAGGLLAAAYVTARSGAAARFFSRIRPRRTAGLKALTTGVEVEQQGMKDDAIPYGVAIMAGTLVALLLCQRTGAENWFACLKIVAETP